MLSITIYSHKFKFSASARQIQKNKKHEACVAHAASDACMHVRSGFHAYCWHSEWRFRFAARLLNVHMKIQRKCEALLRWLLLRQQQEQQ